MGFVTDTFFGNPLTDFQASTNQGQNSICADPMFGNVPHSYNVINNRMTYACTTTRLYLRNTNIFNVGDIIECNFDGIARRITQVGDDYIEIDTPLSEPRHEKVSS